MKKAILAAALMMALPVSALAHGTNKFQMVGMAVEEALKLFQEEFKTNPTMLESFWAASGKLQNVDNDPAKEVFVQVRVIQADQKTSTYYDCHLIDVAGHGDAHHHVMEGGHEDTMHCVKKAQ